LLALSFILPVPASAYLDPSSGSMIFQLTVGGLLAAAGAVRIYWKKLKSIFSVRRKQDR
jgi:hypothetical protein